jgi:lactam utilization protein B
VPSNLPPNHSRLTRSNLPAVTAVTGEEVELPIGDHEVSLCCHSDSPGALQIVTAAREMIDAFSKKMGYA